MNDTKRIELLDETEAADLLRVSVPTLQTWRCRGRGPAFIRCGRAIRYARHELTAWLESRTVRPVATA